MIRSGEWFGAQALNAMRHRMGSRHAIDTVTARRSSQRGSACASQSEGSVFPLPRIATDRPLKDARPIYTAAKCFRGVVKPLHHAGKVRNVLPANAPRRPTAGKKFQPEKQSQP
jgi:hypothetical protein